MVAMTQESRFRVSFVLQLLAFLACLLMAFSIHGQRRPEENSGSSDSRLAVLENRVDAIDRHLQNTDTNEQRTEAQINAISEMLSRMEGEGQVGQWIAWGVITVLSGGSLIVQFRARSQQRPANEGNR